MPADSVAIGIDLGTTYCCVAYMNPKNNQVEIIRNQLGKPTTASVVQFTDNSELIGSPAKEKVNRDERNVIYDSKRLIGQNYDDRRIQRDIKDIWKFTVKNDGKNKPIIEVPCKNRSFKPEEISAKLLKYMKSAAEEYLNKKVTDVVITVPARFNYHQRTTTQEAGKIAGLNVLSIINEPTAAIMAYVHKTEIQGAQNVLVFDLGGGTLDISIAKVEGKTVEIKATSGNTYLGGRDFDNNLSDFIVKEINNRNFNITLDEKTLRRIHSRSEKIKRDLTSSTSVDLDFIGLNPDINVDFEIFRSDFEKINSELFQECIESVQDCLKEAGMKENDIHKVILVGGSTRIPKLEELLIKKFGRNKLTKVINPDEAVAYGAAVHATEFNRNEGLAVITKCTDITPLSLGIRSVGGRMDVIIPRNSSIPITKTDIYFTSGDTHHGTNIVFNIYEGERTVAKRNNYIGETRITLTSPKPPGYQIQLTFHVNANGILQVDSKTDDGVYSSLKIERELRNLRNVTEMLHDAEINKNKDEKILRGIEKWIEVHDYCTKMRAMCTYDRKNFSDNDKQTMQDICDASLNWLRQHHVKVGSQEELHTICQKREEVKNICEPIAKKYNFTEVSTMHLERFNDYISEL